MNRISFSTTPARLLPLIYGQTSHWQGLKAKHNSRSSIDFGTHRALKQSYSSLQPHHDTPCASFNASPTLPDQGVFLCNGKRLSALHQANQHSSFLNSWRAGPQAQSEHPGGELVGPLLLWSAMALPVAFLLGESYGRDAREGLEATTDSLRSNNRTKQLADNASGLNNHANNGGIAIATAESGSSVQISPSLASATTESSQVRAELPSRPGAFMDQAEFLKVQNYFASMLCDPQPTEKIHLEERHQEQVTSSVQSGDPTQHRKPTTEAEGWWQSMTNESLR